MLQEQISGLPVLDTAGRLVGVVTEGDFLRRTETATERKRPRWLEFLVGPGPLADEYVHTHGRKVSEIMSADPVTVEENTPLEEVVALMEKKRVKRIPVVRGDKVVGIVSRANLLHALARLAAEAAPTKATDTAIREQLQAELAQAELGADRGVGSDRAKWCRRPLGHPYRREGTASADRRCREHSRCEARQ